MRPGWKGFVRCSCHNGAASGPLVPSPSPESPCPRAAVRDNARNGAIRCGTGLWARLAALAVDAGRISGERFVPLGLRTGTWSIRTSKRSGRARGRTGSSSAAGTRRRHAVPAADACAFSRTDLADQNGLSEHRQARIGKGAANDRSEAGVHGRQGKGLRSMARGSCRGCSSGSRPAHGPVLPRHRNPPCSWGTATLRFPPIGLDILQKK